MRPLDPWPHSEAGRFHRGLALTLVVLAALIAAAGLVRHHDPVELAALGGVLALSALAGRRLAPAFGRKRPPIRGPAAADPPEERHSAFVSGGRN